MDLTSLSERTPPLEIERGPARTTQARWRARFLAAGLAASTAVIAAACGGTAPTLTPSAPAPAPDPFPRLAARLDPYVDKSRVLVLTDIANEPDDQMSMVRFLVYANEYDVEGLVAGTSTWMRNTVRPDIHDVLATVDATELAHRKIAKRLRRYGHVIDERATRENQQDSCPDDREHPPHRPTA